MHAIEDSAVPWPAEFVERMRCCSSVSRSGFVAFVFVDWKIVEGCAMRLNANLIRSSVLRALAAFCGVNLLVLAPVLFLLFRCSPQEIELETFGDDVLEIAISDATNEDGTVNYCSSVELFYQKTE